MTGQNEQFVIKGSRGGDGLHASSKGDDYPWSVQPRVEHTDHWNWTGGQWATRWVAFNATTGWTSETFVYYDTAAKVMRMSRENFK